MFHFRRPTSRSIDHADELVAQFDCVSMAPFTLPPRRCRRVAAFLLSSENASIRTALWSSLEVLEAGGYELYGVFYGPLSKQAQAAIAERFDGVFGPTAFGERVRIAEVDGRAPPFSMIAVRGAFCWSGPGIRYRTPTSSGSTDDLSSIELALSTFRLYQGRAVPIEIEGATRQRAHEQEWAA